MATRRYNASAASFHRRFGFAPCRCYEKPVAALYNIKTSNSNVWDNSKKGYLIKEIRVECSQCGADKVFKEYDFNEDLVDSDIDNFV